MREESADLTGRIDRRGFLGTVPLLWPPPPCSVTDSRRRPGHAQRPSTGHRGPDPDRRRKPSNCPGDPWAARALM